MNDLILSQMRQRLEILYQMVDELESGGGGSGGDSYTKAQTDTLLSYKADKSNTYNKTQTDNLLNAKANTAYVDEIFATDDITASEGQNLPSFLTDWLRLHKPINLNGNEYYFAEESGVDYVYKTIDENGLLPRFSTAQIMKAGLTVHFYEIGVDTIPTEDSINLITSDAVYDALDEQNTIIATKVTMDDVYGPGTEIVGTSAEHKDLDNYTTPGVYYCRSSTNAGYVDNKPVGGSGFRLTVENISGTNTFRQTFIKPTDASRIYIRHYSTSTWSPWYVFEGTALS